MLEDILYRIQDLVPAASEFGKLPAESLPLAAVSCGLGALILTRFTGNIGTLTIPVNFSALFIGVAISNWLLDGIDLPVDKFMGQPMIIALIGMTMAAFSMMWWLQKDGIRG